MTKTGNCSVPGTQIMGADILVNFIDLLIHSFRETALLFQVITCCSLINKNVIKCVSNY